MSFGLFNINYNSHTFLFILAKVEQNGAFELDVKSRIRVTKKKARLMMYVSLVLFSFFLNDK